MDTYEKHRAAVRTHCRDAFAATCESDDVLMSISLKKGVEHWHGCRGVSPYSGKQVDTFSFSVRDYSGTIEKPSVPGSLLNQINKFAKMPVLMEATFKPAHEKQQEMVLEAGATLFVYGGPSPFIYVGFPTERAAFEFRIGPHGDLVVPMPRD